VEHDDVVDAVEELRPEMLLQLVLDLVLHPLVVRPSSLPDANPSPTDFGISRVPRFAVKMMTVFGNGTSTAAGTTPQPPRPLTRTRSCSLLLTSLQTSHTVAMLPRPGPACVAQGPVAGRERTSAGLHGMSRPSRTHTPNRMQQEIRIRVHHVPDPRAPPRGEPNFEPGDTRLCFHG
jgi:hypothetical protein